MKDFRGQELKIGDKVGVTLTSGTRVANLYPGVITGFVNRSGYECATIKLDKDSNYGWWTNEINKSSSKVVKL